MKRTMWMLAVAALPLAAGAQAGNKDAKPTAAAQAPAGAAKPAPGVNWEGQVLRATGAGAPDMKASSPAQARLGAERAAQMDAFRNLLAQVKGIQVSAGKTVGDALSADEVKAKVEGVIRGYKVVGKRYFSDGGVELDVEVPLAAITAAVLDAQQPAEGAGTAEAGEPAVALNTAGAKKNTGLVVDARGLGVKPALAPRLLGPDGKALYSAEALSDEARQTSAVAAYMAGLDQAKKSVLVGDKPLVLKADKADGSDLVLGAEAVKQLAAIHNGFLAEGRVVIVTN